MPKRTCDVPRCGQAHVAKGMCLAHYKQVNDTHPKVKVACSCCGAVTEKHPSKKYAARFCSYLCRDFTKYGPLSCRLPVKRHVKAKPLPPAPRDCAWCGDVFVSGRPYQNYCTDRCNRKAAKVRRRGRETTAGGSYTWVEVIRIFLCFERCCAYCEQPIDGQPEPDHVVALSRGGSNSITNILPSCALCNSDKRHLTLDEWAADRLRRGVASRVTTWSADDPRYRHLTSVTMKSAA